MADALILFISDLHLSPNTPELNSLFLEFLTKHARAAQQLFILGDLFDAWPGDDCLDDPDDAWARQIVHALRALSDSGVAISLLHGNRDFLLGEDFAARSGVRLLNEPYLLSLPSWQFVLTHGDSLCTDDHAYQAFRQQVRQTEWRRDFLQQSLKQRKAIAASLRQESEAHKRDKAAYLMDVNLATSEDFLRANGYATCIHGHTHRPATHHHIVDGIHVERWVLADWNSQAGEYLAWNGKDLHRQAFGHAGLLTEKTL
ncbi:MAG: UDP-2,3-diacylglucosamine diphosphatase [Pseudomonadota bacterium]